MKQKGNIDRLDRIMADDVTFTSYSTGRKISRKESVKEYLKQMYEVQVNSRQHIDRRIESIDFDDEIRECISISFEESTNDQYMFIDLGDDGKIKTIVVLDKTVDPVFH